MRRRGTRIGRGWGDTKTGEYVTQSRARCRYHRLAVGVTIVGEGGDLVWKGPKCVVRERMGKEIKMSPLTLTKSVVFGVFWMEALDIYYIFFSKKPKSGYKCLVAIFSENSLYLTLNSLGTRPWKFFFFLFFPFRNGTRPGIEATHTLPHSSLQLLSRGGASQTRMLPHGPSSFHSYTIVTSVRRRDETKRHKTMSA